MALFAVLYLALAFVLDTGRGVSEIAIGALAVVFLTEFFVRLWAADSRRIYLRKHWIDLVSSIPLVGGLRSLRLLRLMKLGAAVRILTIEKHEAERHNIAGDSFWLLGPVLLVIWFGAAAAYWSVEHGANPNVHNFGDALYWAFITATTVGYGDIAPVTAEGRIISGLLVFIGIGLVGILSARLTQKFIQGSAQSEADRRMTDLELHVREMHRMVKDLHVSTANKGSHEVPS